MSEWIHWHEGLFLQPQHLQLLQRNAYERIDGERKYLSPFPYGLVEARFSEEDLQNHTIRFEKLEVVLPSGTLFQYPEHADLPALEFKDQFRGTASPVTIYLGVPRWSDERPNVIDATDVESAAGAISRFQVVEKELSDENTGQNPQIVQMRRLNGILLTDQDEQSNKNIEYIPLLRIGRTVSSNSPDKPCIDPGFVAPTLQLRGASIIREMVRSVATQITAVRDEYSELLADSPALLEDLRGESLKHFLRLRVLARFEGRLTTLAEIGTIPLLDLYLELRELLAEFASLEPHNRDFVAPPYVHDQPYSAFSEICSRIRKYLVGPKPSYIRLNFFREENHFTTPTNRETFRDASGSYIAIKTEQDVSDLVRLVEAPSQFQLLPATIARDKVAVRGIVLKEVRDLPYGVPREPNLYYFRICDEDSRDLWSRLLDDTHAWIQFSNLEASDYEISLIIHKPNL